MKCNSKPRHEWTGFLLALSMVAGCCGVGVPSQEKVDGWLAQIPPGSSGADAFNLLKAKGFSPKYKTPQQIEGQVDDTCLFFRSSIIVDVELDEAGRVLSTDKWNGQNFP